MGLGRAVQSDAGSSKVARLMRSWIKECRETHQHCRWDSRKRLPDRVLYIGAEREPYLHITTKEDRGYYAALSHCWGGATGIRTMLSNIDQFRHEIPFERFPRNFQDAIEICRSLGMKYLWIDSLCIIQDSKLDWQEQSAKMADIYSKCAFAVAADGAKDSHAGFLRSPGRQIAAGKVQRLPWPPNPGGEEEGEGVPECVYVRLLWTKVVAISMHGGHDSSCHIWSDPPDGPSPLSTRGWVLQETMLAPRTLHFCSDEVVWECRTCTRCECMNAPNTDSAHRYPAGTDTWMHSWDVVVAEFTSRSLTFQTDKLEAIAGIARREMTKIEKEQGVSTGYVAGLWTHNLRGSLHWRRAQKTSDREFDDTDSGSEDDDADHFGSAADDDTYYGSDMDSDCTHRASHGKAKKDLDPEPTYNPSRRVESYIAPSWSWASVTGRILVAKWHSSVFENLEENADNLELEEISIECEYAGPNKFGAVMEGTSLTVTAETFTLHVLPSKRPDGTDRWDVINSWPRFCGRILEINASDKPAGDFSDYRYGTRACYFDTDEDEEALKAGNDIFTVVNLTNYTTFLILKEVYEDGETHVYRRVGIMGDYIGTDEEIERHQGYGQRRRVRIV